MKTNNKLSSFKHILICLICLFLIKSFDGFCQGPHVYYVNGSSLQIQYVCRSSEYTYDIEMPVFRLTDLVYNQTYSIVTTTSSIFDNVSYEPWPYSFQPYGTYWKWPNQSQTTDTILLDFTGYYQNLTYGASELLRYGIYTVPPPSYGDEKYVSVSIVPSYPNMVISGNELYCSNPVSFSLQYMPTSYTSATWEIIQGSVTKASGSGTEASASNLSNGNGIVNFTIHYSCGLKDLVLSKPFHFGPYSSSDYPITGPSSASCRQYVYYSIPSLSGVTSINWTWPSNWTYVSGQNSNNLSLRTGNSGGMVMVRVNNNCGQGGSYSNKYTSVSGCYSLVLSPNPVSDFLNVKIEKIQSATVDSINSSIQSLSSDDHFTVYNILIENKMGTLIYSNIEHTNLFSIPVQAFKEGNYFITIQFEGNIISGSFIKTVR